MTETKCGKCREFICDCVCPDVTGYSRKRRWLREHRKTMRVMQGLIEYRELGEEYQHALSFYTTTVADIWADGVPDAELDESSDVEDPEKKAKIDLEEYKKEVADKETFFQLAVIDTAAKSVEDKQVHLDLERARMEREDLRGQILRAK
jgi:hypothetical protein